MKLADYARVFGVVELQSTFYRLPKQATAETWRGSVPEHFEFTVKVFQGVTHPAGSPTWRKAGSQQRTSDPQNYGHLQNTPEVFRAWNDSAFIGQVLRSTIFVVQLPPSFKFSRANLDHLRTFFSTAGKTRQLALELRDESWFQDPDRLGGELKALGVTHIVDPLVREPLCVSEIAYFRLHGLGKERYRYTYTEKDLERLHSLGRALPCRTVYYMFNNFRMRENALALRKLVGS